MEMSQTNSRLHYLVTSCLSMFLFRFLVQFTSVVPIVLHFTYGRIVCRDAHWALWAIKSMLLGQMTIYEIEGKFTRFHPSGLIGDEVATRCYVRSLRAQRCGVRTECAYLAKANKRRASFSGDTVKLFNASFSPLSHWVVKSLTRGLPALWTTMTWRSRTSLVVAGAFCIILLIATSFIANTHPEGCSIPSLSGTQPSQETERDEGVPASASSTQHAIEGIATKAPTPMESLREFSRFDSYSLASGECDAEFKDLFKDTERSPAHRQDTGNVISSDIDLHWKKDGALRAMIWRQKVTRSCASWMYTCR